jgi:transcriptional regulator with XRE-family HTH domain
MGHLREHFGKHLLAIRRNRRLTQEQFAELVGISVDFLSLIERGISAPSFEKLEQFADRLGMPVSSLFAFDQERSDVVPDARRRTLTATKRLKRAR